MNWLDGIIIGIIVASMLVGIIRGLTREVLSVISWIIATWVGLRLAPTLAPLLESRIDIPLLRLGLAFTAVFLMLLIIGAVINYFVGKLVRGTVLSGTDRLLGIFFGAARGVFVSVLFLLLATQTALPNKEVWKESRLLPSLDPVGIWLLSCLPQDMLASRDD